MSFLRKVKYRLQIDSKIRIDMIFYFAFDLVFRLLS